MLGKDPKKESEYPPVISFILEDDINEDISDYYQNRREALKKANSDEIANLLNADWYIDIWKEADHKPPKLEPDIDLLEEAKSRIQNVYNSIEDRLKLLIVLENSIYSIPYDLGKLKDNLYHELALNDAIIKGLVECADISDWYKKLSEEEKQKFILEYLAKVVVSIDIEADEENIYQFGYDGKLFSENRLSHSESEESIENTFKYLNQFNYWLIGHNIICWDIPRIKKDYPAIPTSSIVWDTLLISWMLQPSKKVHALTSSEKAHNAKEDSKATLNLFFKQIENFNDELFIKYDDKNISNAERLILLAKHLKDDRVKFLSPPEWLKEEKHLYVIPEFLLEDLFWVSQVGYAWPEGHSAIDDMFVDLDKIDELLTNNPENIYLNLLRIVVNNAIKNDVLVILRMIPSFIKDNIQEFLNEVIVPQKRLVNTKYAVLTYESLAKSLSPIRIQEFFNNSRTILMENENCLISPPEPLSREQVKELKHQLKNSTLIKGSRFLEPLPDSGCIFKVDDTPVKVDKDGIAFTRWIEFFPALRNLGNRFPLALYKRYYYNLKDLKPLRLKNKCTIPIWMDSETYRSDRIFLDPQSGNRRLYWNDCLSRLMSILNEKPDEHFIFLTEFQSEAQIIEKILAELNFTKISNKSSTLRKIEDVFLKSKKIIYISTLNNAKNILNNCSELNIDVQFVIESVPINKWKILFDNTSVDSLSKTLVDDDQVLDEVYDYDKDDDEENEGTNLAPKMITYDLNSLGEFLEKNIRFWLVELFGVFNQSINPIVLDSRLSLDGITRKSVFDYRNYNYLVLSEEFANRFNLYSSEFSDIERKKAPTEYDRYKDFLFENWGYSDFKETQCEPLKAIIENNKDVIVRLPTGEGKSIIFQVPALFRSYYTKRLSIVISPLRALMTDQVERLWNQGFMLDADYLSGDRESWENNEVYQRIVDGQIKLLYVAPERFRVKKFREAIYRRFNSDKGFE